jgi:hypothetical protein
MLHGDLRMALGALLAHAMHGLRGGLSGRQEPTDISGQCQHLTGNVTSQATCMSP